MIDDIRKRVEEVFFIFDLLIGCLKFFCFDKHFNSGIIPFFVRFLNGTGFAFYTKFA